MFVSPVLAEPVVLIRPGELPVVLGGEPGSVNLTNERIAELFGEDGITD